MNNNLSDSNIPDNTAEEEALYKQFLHDISTGTIDFQPFEEEKNDSDILKTTKTSANYKQSVAGKVKGVAISQSTIESTITNEGNNGSSINEGSSNDRNNNRLTTNASDIALDTSSIDPVENLVREWEAENNRLLSSSFRKITRIAASIHIMHQRGITVSDLVGYGFGLDYAQKLLPQAVVIGLLVRLDNRLKRQHQYVLSNYVHNLYSTDVGMPNDDEILPFDVTLILARELSGMKYVYHSISLVTTLNYKTDYDVLNWDAPSDENKQKIHSFNLEPKRSVNFRIAPSGTVNISIECTYRPFEFHTAAGLMNFFGIYGKIDTYLQLSTKNRVNVVLWFGDWSLMQFEYNKDLPTNALKDKYSSKVINWSSKGVLRVRYLGVIFQIYCKMMPFKGECLRAEGRFSTKDKVKIVDRLPRINTAVFATGGGPSNNTDGKSEIKHHPFTTIEEMLLNRERDSNAIVSIVKGKEEGEL